MQHRCVNAILSRYFVAARGQCSITGMAQLCDEVGGETQVSKESKTTLRGRDSRTGTFIPVKDARRRPETTQVERVPKPGFGDTKPSKK
jgi:hypothetical protein